MGGRWATSRSLLQASQDSGLEPQGMVPRLRKGYSSSSVTSAYWARRAAFLCFSSSDTILGFTTICACFSIRVAMACTSSGRGKGKEGKGREGRGGTTRLYVRENKLTEPLVHPDSALQERQWHLLTL